MEKRKIVFYLTIGMILILHLTACTNRSSELPAPDSTVFGYEGETKIIFDGVCAKYNDKKEKSFEDILDFHVKFERIHPFQDGNGRVGRLILFKECLKYNIVPFIIDGHLKMFYYRGLKEWDYEKGYLIDTCLSAQDKYKADLDYFRIAYENNKSN